MDSSGTVVQDDNFEGGGEPSQAPSEHRKGRAALGTRSHNAITMFKFQSFGAS